MLFRGEGLRSRHSASGLAACLPFHREERLIYEYYWYQYDLTGMLGQYEGSKVFHSSIKCFTDICGTANSHILLCPDHDASSQLRGDRQLPSLTVELGSYHTRNVHRII